MSTSPEQPTGWLSILPNMREIIQITGASIALVVLLARGWVWLMQGLLFPVAFRSVGKGIAKKHDIHANGDVSILIRVPLRYICRVDGGVDSVYALYCDHTQLSPEPLPREGEPEIEEMGIGYFIPKGTTRRFWAELRSIRMKKSEWEKTKEIEVQLRIEHGLRKGCIAIKKTIKAKPIFE